MGDRGESERSADRKAGKSDQLALLNRIRVAKFEGGEGGAFNLQDCKIVRAILAGQGGTPHLCLSLGIAHQNDKRRAIGIRFFRHDMRIRCNAIAVTDHEARTAHDKLGAVGLLVSTDDDDRWLDPLYGFGHLG